MVYKYQYQKAIHSQNKHYHLNTEVLLSKLAKSNRKLDTTNSLFYKCHVTSASNRIHPYLRQ